MGRHIRQHARRSESFLERESVGERFQRRAGLTQRGHAVDGAAELRPDFRSDLPDVRLEILTAKVIARPLPRQPLPRPIVEHRDGRAVRSVAQQVGPLRGDDAANIALERGVERCDHAAMAGLSIGPPIAAEATAVPLRPAENLLNEVWS